MVADSASVTTVPRWRRELYRPVLAPLVQDRRVLAAIWAVGVVQIVLTALGGYGWPCPVRATLGFPCPGCGLSRAVWALLQGRVLESLQLHAFAPLFLLVWLLLTVVSLLPGDGRRKAAAWIERAELKTGLTSWALVALLGYWLARMTVSLF